MTQPIRYITLCSGIECVSVAALPLGWEPICFSEVEKFPSAVLAHHYPNVPNVGDMTAHDWRQYRGRCDVLAAGTPCQAFSVAGLGESLGDPRGNLTLKFAEICDDIDPGIVIWENVPGVLSTRDNAFGCLLGALAGETAAIVPDGGKWTDAGVVAGPRRTVAWRVLDAQYFGVAQRRRRVFLVASHRTSGIDPAAILFESDGLRRHSPPRREAAEEAAADVGGGAFGNGLEGGGIARPLMSRHHRLDHELETFVVGALAAESFAGVASGRPEGAATGHFLPVVAGTLTGSQAYAGPDENDAARGMYVAHTLRGDGFDASEDGTGRGTPLILETYCLQEGQISRRLENGPAGKGWDMEVCATMPANGKTHAVAFTCKDCGGDAGELSPTLRSLSHDKSHANGGGQVAVAFQDRFRGDDGRGYGRAPGASVEQVGTLETVKRWHVALEWLVRRLTPRECERLQGLPDDYTRIPYSSRYLPGVSFMKLVRDYLRYLGRGGGKTFRECHPDMFPENGFAADGPRYKAIGNGMAVVCVAWLLGRVDRALRQINGGVTC